MGMSSGKTKGRVGAEFTRRGGHPPYGFFFGR